MLLVLKDAMFIKECPMNQFTKILFKCEDQCFNMRSMYFGGKYAPTIFNICSESATQLIEFIQICPEQEGGRLP